MVGSAHRKLDAILALGEMGVGNTTAVSAVTAAFTRCEPSRVTGRGTGVESAGISGTG